MSPEEPSSSKELERLRIIHLAVSFLLKNKFCFDLPFSEGVPYLSRTEERQIRASWAAPDPERATIEDMVLKVDDKPLVDQIHLSVQHWLSQPLVDREDYLNIPHTTPEKPRVKYLPEALNRYQIRLTHQIIRKDYANLKTLGKDGFVRITLRNEKEDAEEKLRRERYRERDVVEAIEFRWIIEALCGGDISKIPERCFLAAMPSDVEANKDDAPYQRFVDDLQQKLVTRRRVLFGHNCFIDLVYLYACFIGDLPERVEDFQKLTNGLFPAVVDTKYLASLVKELRFNSNLETLEKQMRAEKVPIIELPVEFDRYASGEYFHEAGFDSLMTAKIAIKLSAKLEKDGKLCGPRKPQKIVKAGKTILIDPTADTEDEEQTDEYVTASESDAETESVMSALASKLSAVFSASSKPTNNILEPFEGDKLPGTDSAAQPDPDPQNTDAKIAGSKQSETERESHGQPDDHVAACGEETKSETSANGISVVAVKEKALGWRNSAAVKRIKNNLAHNNMFDALDTPADPITDRDMSSEPKTAKQSVDTKEDKTLEADLIWSDKEDQDEADNDSDEEANKGISIPPEKEETPMTASQLEDKINNMAKKGEMMPRWDSESGIWNVIGNRLLVNSSEEGVCIL